jgi:4-amino-4-deoxy-L-arabinose transferase-like glycosyltransferase
MSDYPDLEPPLKDSGAVPADGKRVSSGARGPSPSTLTARDLVWLPLAGGFLFFIALGARDLWNPNEPIYGRAVVEMAERDEWTTPTVNGQVFAEKPILYFWLARASSIMMGEISELSLRIPSALGGVASVLLTYLIVLPYAGRRRALITAALLATLCQVFWASRSVQMDILVLVTTLGALIPLTRMLDFRMRPARAWILTGIAAGVGFIAKGPVTWILPGLVILFYALSQRKLHLLFGRWIAAGAVVATLVGAPWYLALWLSQDTGFLHEVLIRQNFSRFVQAWDHHNPWWYYFTYLWVDYAPWSWLLPAALLNRPDSEGERSLERMSWIWIAAIVIFFSLSESKRAPYILPIAPAVAVLAASVIDRWSKRALPPRARIAASVAFVLLAAAVLAGGIYCVYFNAEVPPVLRRYTLPLGLFLIAGGSLLGGLASHRSMRQWVPAALFGVIVALYVAAVTVILPAVDPMKSARGFSVAMDETVDEADGTVVSYGLWDWRAEYAFYAGRTIPNLKEPELLRSFWRAHRRPYVIVERADRDRIRTILPDAALLMNEKIGSREAFLFGKAPRELPFKPDPEP